MPPSRKRRESWSEDEAMPKKAKKGAQDAGSSAGSASKDADGNHFWEVSRFKLLHHAACSKYWH